MGCANISCISDLSNYLRRFKPILENVKIEQDKENSMIHRVYLDGKEIKRIAAVDFRVSSEFPVPEVNIKIAGGCDFEGMADIHFDYSPYTVK